MRISSSVMVIVVFTLLNRLNAQPPPLATKRLAHQEGVEAQQQAELQQRLQLTGQVQQEVIAEQKSGQGRAKGER